MVQQVKVHAAQPEELSSNLKIHMKKEIIGPSRKVPSDLCWGMQGTQTGLPSTPTYNK